MISPGPGNPINSRDVGNCIEIIRKFAPTVPILGVCFGHQSINVAFGGSNGHSKDGPVHGKAALIGHDGSSLYDNMSPQFYAGRYHSLCVDVLADDLLVTARNEDGLVMGIRHKQYHVFGVQFHPESVLTPEGKRLVGNFLRIACPDEGLMSVDDI